MNERAKNVFTTRLVVVNDIVGMTEEQMIQTCPCSGLFWRRSHAVHIPKLVASGCRMRSQNSFRLLVSREFGCKIIIALRK